MKIILIIVVISFFAFPQEFRKTATSGFTFLQIPVSARGAAMGETIVSLADLNAEGFFVNPAATGFTERLHSLSVSYSNWFADIKNYATAYSLKTDFGVITGGILMLDYGTMPRTTVAGGQKVFDINGSFTAASIAAGISYSKMLTDRFSFGILVKYVDERIDIYNAYNILMDGGILYYTGLGSLRIAASIQNFGTNSKFINDEFKMPTILRLGASGEVLGDSKTEYRLTLATEVIHPNNGDEKVNIGAELGWRNFVQLRGGYKFFYDEESFSFGIGVSPGLSIPINMDFAYSSYGRLGNNLRFSVQIGWL